MDYLIGSATTTFIILFAFIFIKKINKKNIMKVVSRNQSYVYEAMKPYIYIDSVINRQEIKTQSSIHNDSLYVRIIVVDSQAYWIKDNTFFVADMVDDMLDKESIRAVDTMGMNKVELDKMIFIVDSLTEGADNDSWNSGN